MECCNNSINLNGTIKKIVNPHIDGEPNDIVIINENNEPSTSNIKIKNISTSFAPTGEQVQHNKYLYYAEYDNLDYDEGEEYFLHKYNPVGACSSCRNGNYYGRNYDWYYDDTATFVVHRKATQNKYASIGIVSTLLTTDEIESGLPNEKYKYLPFQALDGINEAGVVCNINVVEDAGLKGETTGTNPGKRTIPMICLARRILDECGTAQEAIEKIQNEWNIVAPHISDGQGGTVLMELHFMIADPEHTYVVEFIHNEPVITEQNIMTNFYLSEFDGNTATAFYKSDEYNPLSTTLTPHSMGLERYDIIANGLDDVESAEDMLDLMAAAKYTTCYNLDSDPFWYSEFCGETATFGDLNIDSLPEDFYNPSTGVDSVVEYAINKYLSRKRENKHDAWQTVHNSVYDIENKKLYLRVQEEDKVYTFKLPALGNDA